jgi:hypothetical protein
LVYAKADLQTTGLQICEFLNLLSGLIILYFVNHG